MKLAAEPGGNTPRATCERTDAVELGRACRCTARYETPRKRKIAIEPRTARGCAAVFPWGRRNAFTPFAIASTPVSAVEPDEKARNRTKIVIPPAPVAIGSGTCT